MTYFYGNGPVSGQGQVSGYVLPYTGTYLIEVSPNNGYTGEYRFRVTQSPPTLPFVINYDDAYNSNTNVPTLTNTSPGNLTATVAGYISQGDPNGEYFSLGSILAGTTINLTLAQPATSLLGGVLNIYNSSGTNLTNNITAGNSLSYTVPASGAYYARVSSASTTTVSFWMDWNGTNNEIPLGLSGEDLYFDNGEFGFNGVGPNVYGISSASLKNSWHLVTAVFVDGNGTNDQLWIDGVKQTLTQYSGTLGERASGVDRDDDRQLLQPGLRLHGRAGGGGVLRRGVDGGADRGPGQPADGLAATTRRSWPRTRWRITG